VSKELSSLKDSTAALAQQLFAKREEIYKKLDANDNIVLTKLDKKEVLSQAVQLKQAYDKDMDEFKCKVNANLYILEKILTPKVKSTKVDFDGKNYSLRVVVQLGKIREQYVRNYRLESLHALANHLNIRFFEKVNQEKLAYAGSKTLDLEVVLNDEHTFTSRIAKYIQREETVELDISHWEGGYGGYLTNELVFTNLSAEDVASLDTISLRLKRNYEYSECVGDRFDSFQNSIPYKKYKFNYVDMAEYY
jgi:hypothetical protein